MTTVDIVIIGLNSERTLKACLDSVFAAGDKNLTLKVYYVDGGSTDKSLELAGQYEGVTLISCDNEFPTPGGQRNCGWQQGNGSYVQFLDSDTILDPHWLTMGLKALEDEQIGAVCGLREELHPQRSVFNWIGNLEWNLSLGEIGEFGGDVLVKREVLVKSGGYNQTLIAGEDPELSYRIGTLGYRILRLNIPMTKHDLAMYSVKQYWRRAYRTGHAYAQNNFLHKEMAGQALSRILKRGGVSLLLLLISLVGLPIAPVLSLVLFPLGVSLLLRPRIFLLPKFKELYGLSTSESKKYSLHASLVVIPQFFGFLRYHGGRLLNLPLRNKAAKLRTG